MVDGDDAGGQGLGFTQQQGLAFRDRSRIGCGRDPVVPVIAADDAGADRALELLFGLFGGDYFLQRDLEQARRIVGIVRDVDVARQPVANFTRFQRQTHDARAEFIARRIIVAAEGEHENAQEDAGERIGKILHRAAHGLLEAVQAVGRAERDDRAVRLGAAVVLEPLEDAGQEIDFRQRVGETPGQLLLDLQAATERRHGEVGDEREVARCARELAIDRLEALGAVGHLGETAERDVVEEGAGDVRQRE
jgi:hypothetical protein